MAELEVLRISEVRHPDDTHDQIERIFFETSGQREFFREAEREEYYWRWCGAYLEHCSDMCFLLVEGDMVRGYLFGCLDTGALRTRFDRADDLDAFSAYWARYPAHLHINLDVSMQRKGYGQQLVSEFLTNCEREAIAGVHVITAAGAANRVFYEKCGFETVVSAFVRASELVFLGKRLKG